MQLILNNHLLHIYLKVLVRRYLEEEISFERLLTGVVKFGITHMGDSNSDTHPTSSYLLKMQDRKEKWMGVYDQSGFFRLN